MEYPDFIKKTGRQCPVHKCDTYWLNKVERCPGCDIHRAKKDAQKFRDERIDHNRLKNYNDEKYNKKKPG